MGQAQSVEKVKGNRNVTIQQTPVNSFKTIIIDEGFEIDLVYSKEPYVEIETDENIHEFFVLNLRDSVLNIDLTKRVTSKKRLNIKVAYDDFLTTIETRDNAEVHSLSTINADNMTLITSGNSEAGLTIKTENFNFEGLDKSDTKLNVTANTSKVILNGNSKLEALINSPILKADLYQRANAEIEGSCDNLTLRTDNNAQFTGKNFTIKNCDLISEIASEAILEVTDTIAVEISGASSLYLYNEPQIIVNKLANTSKIQKKEK
ncbi:Putative auto-transporter adhesin, head GIN domain [Algibacter lectus]|nr:Putative auto-transporter adhesin, head GIN domain [Algibacter lectus]